MKVIFEIIGKEKVKNSPMKPEFSIYHLKLLPVSLLKGHGKGFEMLGKMGLGKYKDLLDTSFSDNERAFQAVIPQTKRDVDKFCYEVGGHVMLEMYPVDGDNDGGK